MEKNATSTEVKEFYDNFSRYQKRTGINLRIRTIFKNLKAIGLNSHSNVLEIGCGTGTLTSLIGKHCHHGYVLATDISSEGINTAKAFTKRIRNIQFMVTDMNDFETDRNFDFVIFADVLEHIPLEQHSHIFSTIRKLVHANSIVAINIPSPFNIEWHIKYKPEILQIIDQPLYTNLLLNAVYENHFYLYSLTTYSLYYRGGDYQWIILKPDDDFKNFKKKSSLDLKILEAKSRLLY